MQVSAKKLINVMSESMIAYSDIVMTLYTLSNQDSDLSSDRMGVDGILDEPGDGDPESPLRLLDFPLDEFFLNELNNLTLPNWNSSIDIPAELSPKTLTVCSNLVKLEFPKYPPIGDLLGGDARYKDNKAYDALDNSDCPNDYRFDVVAKPANTKDGGKWITEHPMEAQTVQEFFENLLKRDLTTADIPSTWRIAEKPDAQPQRRPNPC